MKQNMSTLDRSIRVIFALTIIVLWFTKVITGTWLMVGFIITIIFLITSAIGFCPLYRLFGKNVGTKRSTPSTQTPPPSTPTV